MIVCKYCESKVEDTDAQCSTCKKWLTATTDHFEHVTDGEDCPCGPDTETYRDEGLIVHNTEQ